MMDLNLPEQQMASDEWGLMSGLVSHDATKDLTKGDISVCLYLVTTFSIITKSAFMNTINK